MAGENDQPTFLRQRLHEPRPESEQRHAERATEHPEQVVEALADGRVASADRHLIVAAVAHENRGDRRSSIR